MLLENYLLEELVTFAKYGTLAATAAHLNVTQPTVTRGMQKLEDDLAVPLFDRQPNHLTLTATGQLAAREAQRVLDQNAALVTTVRQYQASQTTLQVAATAPGPLLLLNSLTDQLTEPCQVEEDLLTPAAVADQLTRHDAAVVLTNEELQTDTIESRFVGTEQLAVNLDQFTYLANQSSVTFAELKGLSFVVITDIGVWKAIIQANIPDAKFLYQAQVDAFTEITKYSNLPYFSTAISDSDHHHPVGDDRVTVPISDPAATMTFYAAYLKTQRHRVTPLITTLAQAMAR